MGMRGERDGGRFAVYSERVPAFLSNRLDPPANSRRSSFRSVVPYEQKLRTSAINLEIVPLKKLAFS